MRRHAGRYFRPAIWGLCVSKFPLLPATIAYASMPQNSGLGASMAEESEGSDSGAESSGAGFDPTAKGGAQSQFAPAAPLDLTAADKAELARSGHA